MTFSLQSLRSLFYALVLSAGILTVLILNQVLNVISVSHNHLLHRSAFVECNGEVCRTILSER